MLFWSLQKTCSFRWISLSSVPIIVVVVLLNSLNTMVQRTANENAAGIFLRDSFFVCPQSPYRHDIVDFSCCPLWRVLHVILVNLHNFGFEFQLRSSPSALSGYRWSVDHLITSILAIPCWRNPTRPKQLSTVATVGFQFGLNHVVVPLSFLSSISLASLFSVVECLFKQ